MFQVYNKVIQLYILYIQIYIYTYIYIWKWKLLSHVQLFATPWTVAYQAPLTMEFSRQEYWSRLPCPPPEIFPVQRMNPCFPHCRQTIVWSTLESTTNMLLMFQLCLTLCDPIDCSTPGFPVLYYLLEFAQTHVHWFGDASQPSHPLPSPSPPALNLSQHQGLFQWLGSLNQVAKVLELQHQSFQWIFKVDFL